jgi:DNA-directed RNA polymerase subunit RPC12/RpoP
MPVRFRCVYCNQLLGISRRKAGAVVRCTNCEGQIIVPDAEPELQAVATRQGKAPSPKEHEPPPNDLFERNDIDDLLRPFDFEGPKEIATPVSPAPPCPAPATAIPSDIAARSRTRRMLVARIAIGWAATAILAFIGGFLAGRGSLPGQ